MLRNQFSQRFLELEEAFKLVPFITREGAGTYVPDGAWKKWATSAQNLIRAVFGESSPHYTNFIATYDKCENASHHVKALHFVFLSAKEDFEGGYVFNVEMAISGEVFGDFMVLARQSLAEGYKDVAAVLACAALEDALKRYATSEGIQLNEKTMQEVVNALKAASLVSGAQKTLLDAMPKIRNIAMHADWAKISEPDVNSVIGFVEQFLLTKFPSA